MRCPNCLLEIYPRFNEICIGQTIPGKHHSLFEMTCPNQACNTKIIGLGSSPEIQYISQDDFILDSPDFNIIYPIEKPLLRTANALVDKKLADDFNEACAVLPHSPKASSALSRRCLQSLLRDKVGVKKSDLSKEIKEAINK